jgi:hypothetical protein
MKRIIIIAMLLAAPATAQQTNPLATVPEHGPTKFQWVLIEACAQNVQHQFHLYCRTWMDAREIGRLDALRDQGKK